MVTLWWVVFSGDRRRWWWERFLSPGYRHVSLAGYDADAGWWIWYDVSLRATTIDLLTGREVDRLISSLRPCRVVLYRASGAARRPGRVGFWCVPAAKHLLGVQSGALLPRGLYRDLLRSGGHVVEYGRDLQATEATEAGSGGRAPP